MGLGFGVFDFGILEGVEDSWTMPEASHVDRESESSLTW